MNTFTYCKLNSISNKKTSLIILLFFILSNYNFAQTTLFQYNFEGTTTPTINNTVGTVTLSTSGLVANMVYNTNFCDGNNSLGANGWDSGDYYRFSLNTTGFSNLVFSYCNSTNNININSFETLVSTDSGTTFTSIVPSYTPTTTNITKTSATLPSIANNNANVWIYIRKNSNSAASSSALFLDNVALIGCKTFAINSILATDACQSSGTSTVTVNSTPTSLPIGTYTVTYNRSSPTATALTSEMTVSTAGVGAFNVTGLTNAGSSTITVTKLTSGTCENTITGQSTNITVSNATSTPTIGYIFQPTCSIATGSIILNDLPSASWVLTRYPGAITTTGNGTTTTISGLSPGTYTYSVIDSNSGTGLKGEYFNNMILSGTPVLTRFDNEVNFDWGTGSPNSLVGSDNFSVRWSGKVQPIYSQTYTFSTRSDDGIRLWVNGVQIINNWTNHAPTINTGNITLTAGVKYDIVLEYFENGGGAVAQLSWSSTSQVAQIIPQSRLFSTPKCNSALTTNIVINNQPLPSTQTPTIGTIIQPSCNTSTGSAIINNLPTGSWILTRNPSGATTNGSGASTTVSSLSAGTYNFSVIETNNGNGLTGNYYNNMTLSGSPTLSRIDHLINFNWGSGSPDPSIGIDNFSVRWTGSVQANYTETYTFSTLSDDGIRLWINGVQIINNWTDHGPTTDYGSIALTAGVKYNIVLEYYENSGGAQSELRWSSTTQPLQNIPESSLYPLESCSSLTSANIVIDNQPLTPTAPSIGTITHSTCSLPTGSVNLSNLPSGNWTINQTGNTTATYTGTGNTTTISSLNPGTYNFTVTTASFCTSVSSTSVQINGLETKTWNGTTWSGTTTGTTLPTLEKNIIFTGNHTIAVDIDACSCQVNTGVNVIIQSNHNMKIVNQVVVNSGGSLTFENNASLIQINDTPPIPNSGNITYKRATSSILNTDYVYWSSPVNNYTLGGIQTGALYYSFNASANGWTQEGTGTTMSKGIGYIIRGGGTWFDAGSTIINASFIGTPNNGLVNIIASGTGKTNLLGNPYPSALNANAFLLANSTVLEGTLYFWTHNTAIQLASGITNGSQGSGKYTYTSDDYATYNFTGGTATSGQSASLASKIPDGNIASGVGFFADGLNSGGTVVFNNSMRLKTGATIANTQFFKPASGLKTAKNTEATEKEAIEVNRVWLNLTNAKGAFKQTLIGYITGATNEYDRGYDGVSYDGNSFIDFYSVNENSPLTIQGRALPFQENDTVPLGYSSTITGEFTIAIEETDGLLTSQDVFIEDKLTDSYTNLKKSDYTFSTDVGTHNNRFTISYIDKISLGNDAFSAVGNGVVIFNKNKQISIQSSEELIKKIQVFDVSGKLILDKANVNSSVVVLADLNSSDQVLIIKIVLENDLVISKKVVF